MRIFVMKPKSVLLVAAAVMMIIIILEIYFESYNRFWHVYNPRNGRGKVNEEENGMDVSLGASGKNVRNYSHDINTGAMSDGEATHSHKVKHFVSDILQPTDDMEGTITPADDRQQTKPEHIQYAACDMPFWQSRYPLTGYKRRNVSVCEDAGCALNMGREAIRVNKAVAKYPCETIAKCVTVTVKTRHRLDTVSELINSVHSYYPEMEVVVTDDKNIETHNDPALLLNKIANPQKVQYVVVPSKVGEGRKIAAEKATTPYVLIVDDDHVFTNDTNLIKAFDVLQHSDAAIAGGQHHTDWQGSQTDWQHYQGVFDVVSGPKQKAKGTSNTTMQLYDYLFHEIVPCFPGCYVADYVKNIFLADRDAILNAGSWDTNLAVWEHEDFFYNMRKNLLKSVLCIDFLFTHNSSKGELVKRRKDMRKEALMYIFKKWKIDNYYICLNAQSYWTSSVCPRKNRLYLN